MINIHPNQILYLEHGDTRLYAEAIQILSERGVCWARPVLLVQGLPLDAGHRQDMIAAASDSSENSSLRLYDLQGGADLLWPIYLFEAALDIEYLSLLIPLKVHDKGGDPNQNRRYLNAFLHGFWEDSMQHPLTPATL